MSWIISHAISAVKSETPHRGEPIGTSDWFQVCPKTFVSGMVDSDARVPGR